MQRSILIVGAQPKTSYDIVRGYQWGAIWGNENWLDPDSDGSYNWYRTNTVGQLVNGNNTPIDSILTMYGRPLNGYSYDNTSSGSAYTFEAKKGPLPHMTDDERDYIKDHIADFLGTSDEGKPSCAIYYGLEFAYFLYEDPSLPGVCNPGAYFTLRTQEAYTTNAGIYEYTSSYQNSDLTTDALLASGTTTITMEMPWISTNETGTTGFFMSALDYLKPGGYLSLGASTTATGIYIVQQVLSENSIRVSPSLVENYPIGSKISYRDAEMNKNLNIAVSAGDGVAGDSSRRTYSTFGTKGGLTTAVSVESFIPIPWAIPSPYSIRNVPFTDIWLRLQNPGVPLNLDSMIYKINGVVKTDEVQITLIPGGMELFYNPQTNFDLNSRVEVYIYISASPSSQRQIGANSPAGTIYMKVSGDMSYFQPGGKLELGPNPAGETELNEVKAIVSSDEIMINPTQYEFVEGDVLSYTFDDYPLEINYWFDIVDDYLPPLIYGMYPDEGMTEIDTSQGIRFEIKDEGLGVDISTLTFTVNNLVVNPMIYKYSDQWYEVIYTPPFPYYYNSFVHCFATVSDMSNAKNRGFAVWSFLTREGELPIMKNPLPAQCAFPVHHKDDIQVDIYGRSGGASLPSLEFTVDQRHQNPYASPKIYRQK
jgi:hypothetical protein